MGRLFNAVALAVVAVTLACVTLAKAGDPVKDGGYGKEALQAEKDFIADPDSPKLYTMDEAIALHKKTGKPVLCWMGEHVFADFNARKLSQELKDTTIQASMAKDPDYPIFDQFNPRVKFDTNQYVNGGETLFIRTATFKFADGANAVPVEQTTRYKLLSYFDTKKFPKGKDPFAK